MLTSSDRENDDIDTFTDKYAEITREIEGKGLIKKVLASVNKIAKEDPTKYDINTIFAVNVGLQMIQRL